MKSDELRRLFLDFFKDKGHTVVESSPLIPMGDSSLLFTTAGMVQFKDLFSSSKQDNLSYRRAASCQKCLRTSDFDIVGKSVRHHTFFEMLGNFSFGDYFKKESIEFAWEFSTDLIKLDKDRIYISVYLDDNVAYDIWKDHIGIPKERIVRLGKEDNFWGPAGSSGPCGPCSELYYDIGEEMLKERAGLSIGKDNDRYIEYWNLVFNQYNKIENGDLLPLEAKGIDTGMGLERLTMISEELKSVYETDLFKPLIAKISRISSVPYTKGTKASYNVIADHIRAIVFLTAENILPSNEGRGYVIRRILRRAIRFGRLIGIKEPFLFNLIDCVSNTMNIYPELKKHKDNIKKIVYAEENNFLVTLNDGSNYLENLIGKLIEEKESCIPAKEAFKLYDSMGFPVDLVFEIARENNMLVDMEGYENLMEEQRTRARRNWKGSGAYTLPFEIIKNNAETIYEDNLLSYRENTKAKILYLLKENKGNETLDLVPSFAPQLNNTNDDYTPLIVITDKSPCYGESGGQVGDIGIIKKNDASMEITDTQKIDNVLLHYGKVIEGSFAKDDYVELSIDRDRKQNIARNHSATHILQKALKEVLGDHIRQLGSLVNDEKLRFDFSHFKALSKEEIDRIEEKVNKVIMKNVETNIRIMEQKEALKSGALAFFGDKYTSSVRTIKIDDSFELCGGTHVSRSGDIGSFKIISESSISSGTRRIEAITGIKAMELFSSLFYSSKDISLILNARGQDELKLKIRNIIEENKLLEKKTKELSSKLLLSSIDDLASKHISKIDDINYIGFSIQGKNINELKQINDKIKTRYKKLITLLISDKDEQVFYLASVSKELILKHKANDIINIISPVLGGKGGGRDEIAQGKGKDIKKISEALKIVKDYIS